MIANLGLRESLSVRPPQRCYAILDGASVPHCLRELEAHRPPFTCLFSGKLAPDLMEAAPYLVELVAKHPFTEWLLTEGWGQHWGSFVTTDIGLKALRRHLRQFLQVRDPDNRILTFRYYDPRVLRAYLPTCNAEEATTIFGPIDTMICEDEDPATILSFCPSAEGVAMRETAV